MPKRSTPFPRKVTLVDLFATLLELITPDGVQASTWELFQGAIFGRDSERVALDLLPWFPGLCEKVVFSLLRHQGLATDLMTEEEPGRIHHEYRHLFVGGRKVGAKQQELLARLSKRWGGTDKEVIYYGSVDATPQMVRLILAYCRRHDAKLLDDEFYHRRGELKTVRESLLAAVRWTAKRLDSSDLGLLEFQRTNPKGIKWQVLRDGRLSYLHENGKLANYKAPVASLDVQGLAYDALVQAAEFFHHELPEEAARWKEQATALQKTVLEKFWMEDRGYFAMAIDRDEHGAPRLVKTLTSVQAELLETRIFDSLSDEDKSRYISGIVRQMYGPEFLTDVGIRSRALRHHELLPYWDYQGSKVSWVVMTNIFAIGLHRQGLLRLADDMDNRMLNGATLAGGWLEFYYVDVDGKVNYTPLEKGQVSTERTETIRHIAGTNVPESTQAWTASALLRILLQRERGGQALRPLAPTYWQQEIEESILASVPAATLLTEEADLEAALSGSLVHHIDREEGRRLEHSVLGEYDRDY